MGKWSTYRKRGSHNGSSALGPPPPPVLSFEDDDITVTTASASNVGGLFFLQFAAEPGEWEELANYPWQLLPLEVLEDGEFGPGDYRIRESGNGADYLGDSPYSNTITVL